MSIRKEGLKGLGIGLGFTAACVGVTIYYFYNFVQAEGILETIIKFFLPIALFFGFILAVMVVLTSLFQIVTGKGDVLARIKKALN